MATILQVVLSMRKKPHSTHLFVNIRLWLAGLVMLTNGPSPVNITVDDIFASLEAKGTHAYWECLENYNAGGINCIFFSWNNEYREAWNSHRLKYDSPTFTLTSTISNDTIILKKTEINYFNSSKVSISAFLCHNEGFAVAILKCMELKLSMQNGKIIAELWNITVF